MSRIVAGIQSRMGSTRLPGKALMQLGNKPLVHWVIDRLQRAAHVNQVWLLTTTNPEDDALVAAVKDKVKVIRGDSQDVASRYDKLFAITGADAVLRVTGDCPLIDAALIDALVDHYTELAANYGHILSQPYYESSYPNGFNAELISKNAFETMLQLSSTADREHVTPAIDRYPEVFQIARLAPPPNLSRPQWKLSVDTAADLQLVQSIVTALGDASEYATVKEIVTVLDIHPEWQV